MSTEKSALAWLINPYTRTVEPYANCGLRSLQLAVDGYIETGYRFENGDICFVDEEGLLKGRPTVGFYFCDTHQPLIGMGVIVGREETHPDTEETTQYDAKTTMEDLVHSLVFIELGPKGITHQTRFGAEEHA